MFKLLFPFSRFVISGSSMYPTFKEGENIVSFNWFYHFYSPKVGDVVVFKKEDRYFVKRVAKIKNRQIFVIGDNRQESLDSRKFGLLDIKELTGRVILKWTDKKGSC